MKMQVTDAILNEAKKMAMDNYSTWGQWVVETHTDGELRAELSEYSTLESWVEIRQRIADYYDDIQSTAF